MEPIHGEVWTDDGPDKDVFLRLSKGRKRGYITGPAQYYLKIRVAENITSRQRLLLALPEDEAHGLAMAILAELGEWDPVQA
jgi:hypothetical protein